MDARLQYLASSDKVKLYHEFWAPNSPRAIIVFIPGLGDHIGRYAGFVKYFIDRNIGVCLYDPRGQGRSGGRRAHCHSINDFLKDLSQMVEMVQAMYPNAPCYLAGHSFGGQIAINFVAKYTKGIRGLVALSPNIEFLIKIPKWKYWVGKQLSKFFPIAKLTEFIDPNWLTHDEDEVKAIAKDPLRNWHITARMGEEILKNLEDLPRLAYQVKIPSLFCHGSDDKITSSEATRKFYHSLLIQNKELKIYPGAYHQLLHDTMKEKVCNDIYSWIDNQLVSYTRLARSNGGESYVNKDTSYHMFNDDGSYMHTD